MAQVKLVEELAAERHRNMLRFYGWWEDDNHIYLAQQLCMGGELADWLASQPAYSEQLAAKVTYDLLQALTYCHSKGVCHRDVKPQNLLFTSFEPSAYLKLADYGLAVHWHAPGAQGGSATADGAGTCGPPAAAAPPPPPLTEFCGTLDYASPEMLEGSYTLTTDVWSCGVLLHILLTGRNPFRGPSKAATEHRVMQATFSTEDKDGWGGVSQAAKALTKQLLSTADARPAAKQALRHEWIKVRSQTNGSANALPASIPAALQALCDMDAMAWGDGGSPSASGNDSDDETVASSEPNGDASLGGGGGLLATLGGFLGGKASSAASSADATGKEKKRKEKRSRRQNKDVAKMSPQLEAMAASRSFERTASRMSTGSANSSTSGKASNSGKDVTAKETPQASQLSWLAKQEDSVKASPVAERHFVSPPSAPAFAPEIDLDGGAFRGTFDDIAGSPLGEIDVDWE